MATSIKQSPSTSDESSASIQPGTIVLPTAPQGAIQSTSPSAPRSTPIFQDAVQDVDHDISFGELQPQYSGQYYPPNDLSQAFSCLHAGIGVELWCLERIQPGICQELWLFNSLYPNTLSSATSEAIFDMIFGASPNRRRFDCPVFVAEARNGWPRTCNNVKSTNMADLRRHLTTRPGRGYTRQLSFLELCPTCNDDFIDKEEFESKHGYRGELCNNRQPQRRGANTEMQWELLYRQVEAAMSSQHAPTNQNESDSVLPESSAGFPAPSVPGNDVGESPTDPPIFHKEDEAMPYLTPYQLIVDLDSDKGELDTEPHHAPSSASNGLNQPPVSRPWLKSRYWLADVSGHEPPWSTYNDRYTRARIMQSGGSEGQSLADARQATCYDTFSQSSEPMPPLSSDTNPSRSYKSIQEDSALNHTKKVGSQESSNSDPYFVNLDARTYSCSYESGGVSTTDHEEEPFENINWSAVHSDKSPSSQSKYIKSVQCLEQESNETLKNQTVSSPVFDTRATQPPETCSSVSTLSNEKVPCPECDSCFTGKYANTNMRRHVRVIHREARGSTCTICKQMFRRSDALRKHMWERHAHGPPPQVKSRSSK